jgi:lysozyme
VTELQNSLTAAGFPTPATGVFDAVTVANVLAFQKAHPNLTADGKVGPATSAGLTRTIAMRAAAGKVIKTAAPVIPGGYIAFHEWVSAHAGNIALGVGLAVLVAVAGFYLWRHRHDAHGWLNSVVGRCVP